MEVTLRDIYRKGVIELLENVEMQDNTTVTVTLSTEPKSTEPLINLLEQWKAEGSCNQKKTRRKIAKLHFRIACQRLDSIHKATNALVAKTKPPELRAQTIVIEDLHVCGMLKNRRLSKAVANVGMHEFRRQLEYKCQWYGIEFKVADRFYPSSKRCSACGKVAEELPLVQRVYVCENRLCQNVMGRDLNAARNLKNLAGSSSERKNACGENVRPPNGGSSL